MSDPITLYGIVNCDTVKKARAWLDRQGVDYRFHDFRKQGLDAALLRAFESSLGWEALLNRRGTSWRRLAPEVRERIDKSTALAAMIDNPALIRRPVVAHPGGFDIGFDADRYQQLFG